MITYRRMFLSLQGYVESPVQQLSPNATCKQRITAFDIIAKLFQFFSLFTRKACTVYKII